MEDLFHVFFFFMKNEMHNNKTRFLGENLDSIFCKFVILKKKAFVKAASLDREREKEKLALVGMYDHSVLLL